MISLITEALVFNEFLRRLRYPLAATTPMNPIPASESSTHTGDSRPWAIKLATASASLSMLAAAPHEAQAAIVKVTGSPITATLGSNGNNFWDVDSNGITESNFKADAIGNNTTFDRTINWFFSNSLQIIKNRFPTYYGNFASRLASLPQGSTVGPTLPTGKLFGSPPSGKQLVMRASSEHLPGSSRRGVFARNNYLADFNNSQNYFGFKFKIDGQTHYGYGLLDINLGNPASRVDTKTITLISWAYNDIPNQPIQVESFSASVPTPIGLAGLAAGAAWTRKLRRRIRESA